MKTLVVLSALATIVIAAPALEKSFEGTLPVKNSLSTQVKREKKRETPEDSNTNTETSNSNFDHDTTAIGRSFGLKKPLIVKNKHGYRLYRDSEEEKAMSDSHQTCGRPIRVKVCDENTQVKDMMKSSAHQNGHTLEKDIEMAKEVENMHHIPKKMDQNPQTEMLPKNSESEESNEEIEVARQALEHIHKNFGNLESVSLHATTTKDLDAAHDVHFMIAKTEEERMAQWKQAVETIHKNFEIARNIEDSFRIEQESSSTQKNDQKVENIDTTLEEPKLQSEMINCDSPEKDEEKETSCKLTNKNIVAHQAREEQLTLDDLKPAASTIHEMQVANLKKEDDININEVKNEKPATRMSEGQITDTFQIPIQTEHDRSTHMISKATEESESKLDTNTAPSMVNDQDIKKSMESFTKSVKNPMDKNIKDSNEHIETNVQLGQAAESLTPTFTQPTMRMEQNGILPNLQTEEQNMKSTDLDAEQNENFMFVKSADQKNIDTQGHKTLARMETLAEKQRDLAKETNDQTASHVHQNQQKDKFLSMKAAEELMNEFHDPENLKHMDKFSSMKAAEESKNEFHDPDNFKHMDKFSSMKAAEESKNEFHDPDHLKHMDKFSSMKAAEELMNEFHDHDHLKHMNFNHHMHGELDSSSDFGMLDRGQHHSGKFHHNFMTHGKMSDMGNAMQRNFHPSMRDAMEGFASENMLRWQPAHDKARTAYGTGGLASTGAVGVFPNANAGGCGIPLLLSCSPSVVSGSLAKPHPAASGSYTAPAYRTEDNFTFHNKRDIKEINDIITPNVLQPSTILKQKSKTIL